MERWVDPDQIMQTLINLIGNAIKFSPASSTVTVIVYVAQILFELLLGRSS